MKLDKKNRLLLLGFVMMSLLCYRFAIKKTRAAYGRHMENTGAERVEGNVREKVAFLYDKESLLDDRLRAFNVDGLSVQQGLLKFLNREAGENRVKVIDFNAPHRFEGELRDQELQTFIFTLEGGYTGILKTVNALENNGSFGSVGHIHLKKNKDYRTKRTYLRAEVFLALLR